MKKKTKPRIPTNPVALYRWLATMPTTARLPIRIQPELLKAVQACADEHGWNLSDAARYLIARGVAKG